MWVRHLVKDIAQDKLKKPQTTLLSKAAISNQAQPLAVLCGLSVSAWLTNSHLPISRWAQGCLQPPCQALCKPRVKKNANIEEEQSLVRCSDWSAVTGEGLQGFWNADRKGVPVPKWFVVGLQPQESKERQILLWSAFPLESGVPCHPAEEETLHIGLTENRNTSQCFSFQIQHQPPKHSFKTSSVFSCQLFSDDIRDWAISGNI